MSSTLVKMIEEGKGYRTENYNGSNIREIEDIIRFELSMGNTDILEYVQSNYGICQDYSVNNDSLTSEEKLEKLVDIIMDNTPDITTEILEFLEEKLGRNDLCGLWLDTFDNVVDRYNNGSIEDIDAYLLREKYMVISDLDEDGALFIFTKI